MKARIYCENKVPTGREYVGSLDYQYNYISESQTSQSMNILWVTCSYRTGSLVFNDNGRYTENGSWTKMMYAAFSESRLLRLYYSGVSACVLQDEYALAN